MKNKLFLAIVALFASSLSAQEGQDEYRQIRSFVEFTETLQEPVEQKSVLLVFLGAEWCPWSQKFLQEVLLHPIFQEQSGNLAKVVLVPYQEPIQGDKQDLYQNFKVAELPTCILFTPNGQIVTRFGYMPYSPSELVTFLKERLQIFAKLERNLHLDRQKPLTPDEIKENYRLAKSISCPEFEEDFLKLGVAREKDNFFLIEQYTQLAALGKRSSSIAKQLRKEILLKDPKNEQNSEFNLAVIDFKANSEKYKSKKYIQKVIQPLLQYIEKYKKSDQERVWEAEMMVANYLFSKDRLQDAVHYANSCLETAPQNLKTQIQLTLDFIQQKLLLQKQEKLKDKGHSTKKP